MPAVEVKRVADAIQEYLDEGGDPERLFKMAGLDLSVVQSPTSSVEWTIGGVQLSFFPPQRYIGSWVDLHGKTHPSVSKFDLWRAAEKIGKDPNGPHG